MELKFKLSREYIELFKLLKATRLVSTGGHGKIIIGAGEVMLNGDIEYRKRAKIRRGDTVEYEDKRIKIV